MSDAYPIAVIGGGSFGTAIANMMAENGHRVNLWVRDHERVKEICETRTNEAYLPGYRLHDNLVATSDMDSAVAGCAIVFISIPSQSFREVSRKVSPAIKAGTVVVSTTKGIEAEGFQLMSQILETEIPQAKTGVLSGPNLAKEIAARQLTATVIASADDKVMTLIQEVLHSSYFRIYSNSDVYGVELAGALKNIYAIMTGMGAALGLGYNTNSMLITRSLAEMSRFATHMGANPMTFLGLAGVGDLIATCTSPLSRNYRVGYAVGEGKALAQVVQELGQVAEGVNTLKLVKHQADAANIYMPLVSGLYEILFNNREIGDVISQLMGGEQNSDVEFSQ